jgi:hypothetical protein
MMNNQSENPTNWTFQFVITESFLLQLSSTWALDSIYLFSVVPIGITSVLLNSIGFGVLCRIHINATNLYKYLRVYSLNSSLMSLIISCMFLSFSARYFDFFREPIGIWYRCRVFGYGMLSLYLFNNLLDILVVLLRLAIFVPKLRFLESMRPLFVSFSLLVVSLIVHSPLLILYDTVSDYEVVTTKAISYCALSQLGKSKPGIFLNILVIFVRDFLTIILEVVISYMSVFYYVKFRTNAANLRLHETSLNAIRNGNPLRTNHELNRQKKEEKNKHQLLLMTIFISFSSIATHLVVAVAFLLLASSVSENIRIIYFSIVCFAIHCFSLKLLFNVFVFYFLNSNFKNQLRRTFGLN